jgi:hypothetical protein
LNKPPCAASTCVPCGALTSTETLPVPSTFTVGTDFASMAFLSGYRAIAAR